MGQQQQQFEGLLGQQQPAPAPAPALAMPSTMLPAQNQLQQPQYSPQANYYQQQLIKSAQQQFLQQQQQQQTRINGLQLPQYSASQQNSPSTGAQQPSLEPLYTARPAPLYAPKPTYYSPQSQPQPQPLYQARPMLQQQVAAPTTAPGAYFAQQQPSDRNQQLQLQQLIMSYQQQHQQPGPQLAGELSSDQLIQHQSAYLSGHQQQSTILSQQVGDQQRWPQQQQQQPQATTRSRPRGSWRHNLAPSDRDSISTQSRLNLADERRSFTVRSQFTAIGQPGQKYGRQFGFLELVAVALKRAMGLGSSEPLVSPSLDLQQPTASLLRRNQNLAAQQDTTTIGPNNKNGLNLPPVTAIDSGEQLYFRRRVFQYELAISRLISLLAAALVLLSPVAMLLVPKLEFAFRSTQEPNPEAAVGSGSIGRPPAPLPPPQWRIADCGSECDGPLVGFAARFIMLCVAYWAIFLRPRTASLPRLDFGRCLVFAMGLLLVVAYWLFFLFRLFDRRYNDFELQYSTIVQFALSMLESLILLHYVALLLLELRPQRKLYCLKVLRSPDGTSRYYTCGALSIQRCAQVVLDKYHCQFKQFGPHEDQMMRLEDELASMASSRSRPSSPQMENNRTSRRSISHRSERARSRTRDEDGGHEEPRGGPQQVKLYKLDMEPRSQQQQQQQQKDAVAHSSLGADTSATNNGTNSSNNNNNNNEATNSGDQSSDGTSRMKESSLETIRAANSTSDLLVQTTGKSPKGPSQQQQEQRHRDETESVRSGRSRRSSSRHRHRDRDRDHHHHHHHHHHRSNRGEEARGLALQMDAEDPVEEHERRLRRRRLRLLAAVQDTFEHCKQVDEASDQQQPLLLGASTNSLAHNNKQALDGSQAARSLYPRIARSLQKYLRLTRQTGRHNLQSIHEHLAKCLLYKLGARAFLEKFTNQDPVWQQRETSLFADCRLANSASFMRQQQQQQHQWRGRSHDLEINSWSLVCDTLVSRQIDSGTFFVLRQGQVSLLVTVARLPHLNLSEEVMDQKSCKFLLTPSAETSAV